MELIFVECYGIETYGPNFSFCVTLYMFLICFAPLQPTPLCWFLRITFMCFFSFTSNDNQLHQMITSCITTLLNQQTCTLITIWINPSKPNSQTSQNNISWSTFHSPIPTISSYIYSFLPPQTIPLPCTHCNIDSPH